MAGLWWGIVIEQRMGAKRAKKRLRRGESRLEWWGKQDKIKTESDLEAEDPGMSTISVSFKCLTLGNHLSFFNLLPHSFKKTENAYSTNLTELL